MIQDSDQSDQQNQSQPSKSSNINNQSFNENEESSYQFQKLMPSQQPDIFHERQIKSPEKLLSIVRQAKPRLIIDKIILQNFKSYAGIQTIGPFHENFTSVVGPNGSGKSNLIQSMLFIFGFKASWMRLHRLNQLIHNSSNTDKPQKASVEVFFKKILDEPNGQCIQLKQSFFSVRRTVNQQSVSKYYLNNKESGQAQIQSRLLQQGIDLNNNRFLILQGEVQQISQMKQKSGNRDQPGLLEYLQDIIGSNIYLDQIQQATVKYAQIQQSKHEKGELMKLVENELKTMSKGKQQAIKYVKKEKKVYQIQNIMHQVVQANAQNQLQNVRRKLKQAQQYREKIINQQRQKMKNQAQRVKQIRNNKSQIEKMQKKLLDSKQLCDKLNMADKNVTQQIKFKSEDSAKYDKKIKQLAIQLRKIIDQVNQIKLTLPKQIEQLTHKSQQLSKIKSIVTKHDKPQLRQMIKQLETQLRRIQLDLETFREKENIVKKKKEKLQAQANDNEQKVNQYKDKLKRDQNTLKQIGLAYNQATITQNLLQNKVKGLRQEYSHTRNQQQKVQLSLKQYLSHSRDNGSVTNMFQQIMKQKFDGVIGRLGDLGRCNKQYDEIITTACNRLDNIVVKNYDAANKVINYLKKTKLGRISCIILDKISEYRNYMRKNFDPLKNAVRLFDMIQARDEDAKTAFYFAISDTLYCENSDLGLQYSMKYDNKRRRVISRKKNGFIIYQPNGLMIGCMSKRGGFDIKGHNKQQNHKQIAELQQKRNTLNSKCQVARQNLRKLEQQLESISKDVTIMKKEKQVIERNVNEYNYQIKQYLMLQIQSPKKSSNTILIMIKQLESLKKQIVRKEDIRNQFEKKLQSIQQKQRQQETKEITNFREQFKKKKTQFLKYEKEVQHKKAIQQTSVKRIQSNLKEKQSFEKRIKSLQQSIKKLKNQQEEIQNKAIQTLSEINEVQQRKKKCEEQAKKLKNIFEEDQKAVRESKKKVQQVKMEVQQCKQQLKFTEHQINDTKNQLNKMRENYKQLIKAYDFIQQLEDIEHMTIQGQKHNQTNNASFLDSSLLNTSFDGKTFPVDKMLNSDPLSNLSEPQLRSFMLFQVKLKASMTSQMQGLKKMDGHNISIINDFRIKYKDYKIKLNQYEKVRNDQIQLKQIIVDLKDKRLTLFREGFTVINSKLKEVYQLLTRGGDAQLQLIDSLDPFSDGINFSVRPPKKSWKQINKLSGGQKTLSSLSLIFALHYYKPTPLYFMDEIDAALDFKNVSIVADYIKKRTKDAQFIIISLRNNMFDLADKLIGVYKTFDRTKIILFKPSKYLAQKQVRKRDKQNQEINIPKIVL